MENIFHGHIILDRGKIEKISIKGGCVLIGKLMKNSKERLMVTITEHKGIKCIDLRVYNIINDGELVPTADGLVLAPEKVDPLIELLKEAQRKIAVP